ncbi:MotE family protein [Lutispora sp.]|uniref:MotE family protein n=1 Tax=Lutispora sp. TaxID=2828727 RepID=UPI0035659A48
MQQVEKKNIKTTKKNIKLQNFFLILTIILLTTIIVVGGILLFNIGGAKSSILNYMSTWPVIGNVIKPVAENKTPEEIQLDMIKKEKNDLETAKKLLNEKEKELEEKANELASKEEYLKERETELEEKLERVNTSLSSIAEQVEYLEKMDSSKAVQILSNMESKDTVVQIIRNMKKEKSSSILMLMDPLHAAQILEEIGEPEGIN